MRIALASLVILGGLSAHDEALAQERALSVRTAMMVKPADGLSLARRAHAEFLACVSSSHECEHVAHDNGFRYHYVVHDHDTCHHGPSYACYAER